MPMADSTGPPDTEPESAPPEIDVSKPHPARMYDYFLGGKDNFAADRAIATQVLDSWGSVRTAVRENRAFLGRAVKYLASEAGISQFLDLGTGLPSANNVHEVAQAINPEARVVYADNDPIVLAHARALLSSGAPGGRRRPQGAPPQPPAPRVPGARRGVPPAVDATARRPEPIRPTRVARDPLAFGMQVGGDAARP